MLRLPNQSWRSCKSSVFLCRALRAYMITNLLFMGIFISVPCMHCGHGGWGGGGGGGGGGVICCAALSLAI